MSLNDGDPTFIVAVVGGRKFDSIDSGIGTPLVFQLQLTLGQILLIMGL